MVSLEITLANFKNSGVREMGGRGDLIGLFVTSNLLLLFVISIPVLVANSMFVLTSITFVFGWIW